MTLRASVSLSLSFTNHSQAGECNVKVSPSAWGAGGEIATPPRPYPAYSAGFPSIVIPEIDNSVHYCGPIVGVSGINYKKKGQTATRPLLWLATATCRFSRKECRCCGKTPRLKENMALFVSCSFNRPVTFLPSAGFVVLFCVFPAFFCLPLRPLKSITRLSRSRSYSFPGVFFREAWPLERGDSTGV